MAKALIIDGNSIVNRAFFAIRGMTNDEGFPTNAIFGFMNSFDMVSQQLNPDYFAVCFDMKGGTFRNEMYSEYKANRTGMDSDLAVQMPVLKQILTSMGVRIVELQGFEADDLLGTLAYKFSGEGIDAYVLTGDRDALQLVGDGRFVYYHGTKNKIIYDAKRVKEDMGVEPNRICDLKGLMGDSSDNIPGIKGVGVKTALKLLDKFGSVESLIENTADIEPARIKKLVTDQAEMAVLSKKLATIEVDVPIEFDRVEYELSNGDESEFSELIKKYDLKVLAKRHSADLEKTKEMDYSAPLINDVSALAHYDFSQPVYYDLIDENHEPLGESFNCIALYQEDAQPLFYDGEYGKDFFCAFKQAISDKRLALKGDRLKELMLLFRANDISNFEPAFDLSIAAYLLNPNKSEQEVCDLAAKYLNRSIPRLKEIYEQGKKTKSIEKADLHELSNSLAARLQAVQSIEDELLKDIDLNGMSKLYTEIELPLSKVLIDMQINGFKIDVAELARIDEDLGVLIENIESEIYFLSGSEFNINSPKQLGVVLFETLGIKGGKKTKTGYSTAKDVLEKLKSKHPVIPKILEYRTYAKLKSTYTEGLISWVNKSTSSIHSYLEQTVAATGRISSHNPNLQNIPIRYEMGRELRKAFVASSDERVLVSADYSQIELRILAHLSEDKKMIEAYNEGIDIHALTAAEVLGIPLVEVTKEQRSSAKAVNFGLIYGMGEYSLSEDLGISTFEAKRYIEQYFAKYPKVKVFLESCKKDAEEVGYARTLFGRRRPIPELKSKNYMQRQYGMRMAMNTPIQGTSADIIKRAMIDVQAELKSRGLGSKLILQIHDELIVDALKSELQEVKDILLEYMSGAVKLSVPLSIDINVSDTWYGAK